jgi:ankyrin repeat protein
VEVLNTRADIATSAVLERFAEALDLIARYQPARWAHLERDVRRFIIRREAHRGHYQPREKAILTELTFLARRDINAAVVASSILHEGVHARIYAFAPKTAGTQPGREERICREAELRFGEALPAALGEPVLARAKESLSMDDDDLWVPHDPAALAAAIANADREAVNRSVEAPFTAACFALDRNGALELVEAHPEFLRSHVTLFAAAAGNRSDVVAFVLELGVPITVVNSSGEQALHIAASNDAFDVVELLIARGADLDASEAAWGSTALDLAIHGNHTRIVDLLSSGSRDVYGVAWSGNVSRLHELLRLEPELATRRTEVLTPLMWLPNDAVKAAEVATLLLAGGADPTVVNEHGKTAAQIASGRGLDDAAKLLRAAEVGRSI